MQDKTVQVYVNAVLLKMMWQLRAVIRTDVAKASQQVGAPALIIANAIVVGHHDHRWPRLRACVAVAHICLRMQAPWRHVPQAASLKVQLGQLFNFQTAIILSLSRSAHREVGSGLVCVIERAAAEGRRLCYLGVVVVCHSRGVRLCIGVHSAQQDPSRCLHAQNSVKHNLNDTPCL